MSLSHVKYNLAGKEKKTLVNLFQMEFLLIFCPKPNKKEVVLKTKLSLLCLIFLGQTSRGNSTPTRHLSVQVLAN